MIMDFSGCDAVELWLKEHDKYYRCEVEQHPEQPPSFKITPCMRNGDDEILPGPDDDPDLVYLSRDVIWGHVDPSQPIFIRDGSDWTDKSRKTLNLCLKPDQKSHVHVFNTGGEYPSLILIPLLVDHKNIGLLLLKSRHRDYFTEDEIELYEGLAQSVGIALAHRHAQSDLHERVKELTCLYGIARLVAQPDIGVDEILQGIVNLLPPAWLYPEIAFARIILDRRPYSTPNFHEGKYKQTADILVGGEPWGKVEVVYTEERPELDEGPFLKEERSLIETVARELATIITHKQVEQDKLKLQEQLRHADRLATIGQLAAGVAHELNEPLGNILGFTQLIKKCPGLPKQAGQDIEKVLSGSLYAREIVKKLLIFARQLPPRKTNVNLNQLIEEGLHFFESRCAKEGIELIRSLSPDLPASAADPAQLNQVLINLVVNALQAMPKGGRLKIQTHAEGEHVFLIVEDTGIGMTEEVLKKIFTPFFTTKDIGQGTGLGLPVVHGIITSHGGSIRVESKVNHGTKFEIKLPVRALEDLKERREDGTSG
jgi:signal transduction histidine kinase